MPGPGIESSEDSDVFVCEVAGDTPASVSDAVSELPGVSSKRGRTKHGRVAVGVGPQLCTMTGKMVH